jgi:hypothetical protein
MVLAAQIDKAGNKSIAFSEADSIEKVRTNSSLLVLYLCGMTIPDQGLSL